MADFPDYYRPERIGTLFYPDLARISSQAARAGFPPATPSQQKVHLLIIDMQVDFCHARGALYVPGAEADIRRLVEFIFRNAGRIGRISCSLDSHHAHQIFHPVWWADGNGNHPAPFTVITPESVAAGEWSPLLAPEWSLEYLERLRKTTRADLIIWPYHVPIGGVGNALDPELWSAVFWHSVARQVSPTWWQKGDLPRTEHYSIFRPEVPLPDAPVTERPSLLKDLADDEFLFIAGEASSHCVARTVEDLVEEWGDESGRLARTYVLVDCTSPVQHPEIDFTALTEEAFSRFRSRGIQVVQSTDPLPL